MESRGFDANGEVGPIPVGSGPGRARIGDHARGPLRSGGRESGKIQVSRGKERTPVRRSRIGRRRFALRWNGRKPAQTAVEIHHDDRHPGSDNRRIADACRAVSRDPIRRQRRAGLTIPVADRGRRLSERAAPIVQIVTLGLREIDNTAILIETPGPIHGAFGIAETAKDVASFGRQHLRRILHRNQVRQVNPRAHETKHE